MKGLYAMKKRIIIMIALMNMFTLYALARAETIAYQGYLSDKNGAPLNRNISIIFKIYESQQSDTVLWQEQHDIVKIIDGIFNVCLGEKVNFTESLFNKERFIGVTLDNEEIKPRQRLSSSPTAIYSKHAWIAENIVDKIVTTNKIADGTIVNSHIKEKSIDSSKLTFPPATLNSNTFTGKQTFNDDITVNGPSLFKGNIGFFGTDPLIKIPNNDGLRLIRDGNYFGDHLDGYIFEKTDSNGTHPDGGIAFSNRGKDGVSKIALSILGNGNIGIGLKKPMHKFHVNGDAGIDGKLHVNADAVIDGRITLQSPDSSIYSLNFIRTDEDNRNHIWRIYHMNDKYRKNALEIWEYKTDSQGKNCGGDRSDGARCDMRISINEGGNFGINTASPKYKLHTKGDIFADDGWFRVSGTKGLYFENYGGGFYMKDSTWIRTYNNKSFYHNSGILRTDGSFHVGQSGNRFIVNSNGFVGIGHTNPDCKLFIRTPSALGESTGDKNEFIRLFSSTKVNADKLNIYSVRTSKDDYNGHSLEQTWGTASWRIQRKVDRTNMGYIQLGPHWDEAVVLGFGNQEHFRIEQRGNVGIGTKNPKRRLSVNGSAGGTTSWYADSDKRLKKNITSIPEPLKKLLAMKGVNFELISQEGKQLGFIAQDELDNVPEVIDKKGEYYSMQYAPLVALIVEAIKEYKVIMDDKLSKLKKENEALKAKNDVYEKRLQAIEKLLNINSENLHSTLL